jgi:enamine deaminase RidA (YjgF/YER057c/UK114 family)
MKKSKKPKPEIKFQSPNPVPFELPISQMAVAGDFLFTWGYGALFDRTNPKPGMRKSFRHIGRLLKRKGLAFRHVAKVTALISPVQFFDDYNEVYQEFFKPPYPCRTTIPVPSDQCFVELDIVAYKKGLSES